MSYFSRLSDIVTCSLEGMLANTDDRAAAIARIITEIEEGLTGARRSVQSATGAEQRLRTELVERSGQAAFWGKKAREELAAGREDGARQSLMRKRETEDLVAGLEQQLAAAASTREHLSTTMRAIEARLAEAQRRQRELQSPDAHPVTQTGAPRESIGTTSAPQVDRTRAAEIEADLEALRRELQKSN
jgi:phage shock protein A